MEADKKRFADDTVREDSSAEVKPMRSVAPGMLEGTPGEFLSGRLWCVFERQHDTRAEGNDFAIVIKAHVEFCDFCHAQIPERFRRSVDGISCCVFPRCFACADDFGDAVNAGVG